MKKNYYNILYILSGLLVLLACRKEVVNDYRPINELYFKGMDSVQGYRINIGDTLRIDPGTIGSMDKTPSEANYNYEWRILLSDTVDEVISRASKLSAAITYSPGTYTISLRVQDKNTGITWLAHARLVVTTPVYEGFLVLNKVGDSSRLDFLSYNSATNAYMQYINLPERLGVPLFPKGDPYQVSFVQAAGSGYVFLLSSTGTYILNGETFAYNPGIGLSSFVKGSLPSGFAAQKMATRRFALNFLNAWLFTNEDAYCTTSFSGNFSFYAAPVNYNDEDKTRFQPSPFQVSDEIGSRVVMYDQTNRQFVSQVNGASFSTPFDPAWNFPTGKDLLYMTDDDGYIIFGFGLKAYAVLKDPGQPKYYMLRFYYDGDPFFSMTTPAKDYYEEITATDFSAAEQYAVSPELGYLFYSTGSKLYEYDLFLHTSKLMLDKGNEKISYIGFDRNASGKPEFKNWLTVGSYDPAGLEGSNGTLALYSVPPVNGNLVKQQEWTGMGRVISTAYRYRN